MLKAGANISCVVDYTKHPGFKPLLSKVRDPDLAAMGIFKKLDVKFDEFLKTKSHISEEEFAKVFDFEMKKEIAELVSLISDLMDDRDLFKPAAIEATQYVFNNLKGEAIYKKRGGSTVSRFRNDSVGKMVTELEQDGYFIKSLDERKLREFWAEIENWRKELTDRRETRPTHMASCAIPLPQEGKKWAILKDLLGDAGIIDAINAYSPSPMDLDYYALQLSHEYESWWKDCYDDVQLPTSSAAYLHNDQDYSLIKGIIYLKPVDTSNSPFCVIPKSHLFHPSYSRNVFFKGLDGTIPRAIADEDNHGPYYRKQFKAQKYRREFLKLPKAMMGTSHFGDDLLDDDALTKALLAQEVKITSELGNCTVFTGGRTFHRGGMVEKGERWVIQFAFRERDLSWRGFQNRMKRKIKATLPESIVKALKKK